jgi:hypothetical protein
LSGVFLLKEQKMAIAQGVAKVLTYKRQSAKGTLAGASGGQNLRRTTANLDLEKETYNGADEITSTRQMITSRHGVKQVSGAINNLFSPLTYSDLLSALLRRDLTAVSNITGMSITIAAATGITYTVTRASGSFVTDGVRVGMAVRLTAGSFTAGNLNNNLLVLSMTATVLTVMTLNGSALTAEGPIASATLAIPGKSTYVPASGHTRIYYTFEEWYSDVEVSLRSKDVKIGSATLSLPGSGNATIDIPLIGLDQTKDTTQYFTSPTAETTTKTLTAASGVLLVAGIQRAIITDLTVTIDGGQTPADGVVGSNIRPDVFEGKVLVTGSFTGYFEGGDLDGFFNDETEISIMSALTDGTENNANFVTLYAPRVKVNTAGGDDGETGLTRTYDFEALYYNGAGLGIQATTFQLHDSAV